MHTIHTIISLLIVGFSLLANAVPEQKQAMPEACSVANNSFVSDQLMVNRDTRGQRLYLLKNISNKIVILDHMKAQPGAGAGWISTLRPQKWSALAVERTNFSLSCKQSERGVSHLVPCRSVIHVCELTQATFTKQTIGSYWLTEDKPLDELLKKSKERGIRMDKSRHSNHLQPYSL